MNDEPIFAHLRNHSVVHVVIPSNPPSVLTEGLTRDQIALSNMVLRYYISRCGTVARSADHGGDWMLLDTFHDDRLCRRCINATPTEERMRLFEHPQEEDTESSLNVAR